MLLRIITSATQLFVVAFVLFVLLIGSATRDSSTSVIASVLRDIASILQDSRTQWLVYIFTASYLSAFLFIRFRSEHNFWRVNNQYIWLTCLMVLNSVVYATHYSSSVQALTLCASAAIGQGAGLLGSLKQIERAGGKTGLIELTLFALVLLLSYACTWRKEMAIIYEYRGHIRSSGPWDSPNTYGLLMGTGILLAIGLFIHKITSITHNPHVAQKQCPMLGFRWKIHIIEWTKASVYLIMGVVMAYGLLNSYSRGAWLGTLFGVGYLLCQTADGKAKGQACNAEVSFLTCHRLTVILSWIRHNLLPLSVITLSLVVLSSWYCRQTEVRWTRRAFSVSNQNDFSWRNRIAAWEAALQIMGARPVFGSGWDQQYNLYDQFYRPSKVLEPTAIHTNAYFTLGMALGLPALVCFVLYAGLSIASNRKPFWRPRWYDLINVRLRTFKIREQGLEERRKKGAEYVESLFAAEQAPYAPPRRSFSLQIVCHAAAVVLLVGFWFDGGLFMLATASTFWLLIELGNATKHDI